ncbi:MAG: hypothetical protein VCC36_11110, partial [Gammaproteobacteria bacterium]
EADALILRLLVVRLSVVRVANTRIDCPANVAALLGAEILTAALVTDSRSGGALRATIFDNWQKTSQGTGAH